MEYTKDNPLKVVTLCSGYDSQCLALNRIKQNYSEFAYELIAWAEVDKYAIQAHNVLFPQYADRNMGDITVCDWSKITQSVDLLTYSTPCQSISSAGKQDGLKKGSGTASSIIWSVLNAIDVLRPKYLLMENVKALVSNKFIGDFKQWQGELAKRDYTNFVRVLDSQHYGVPQHRERVFMVSILDENASFHFPEPFQLEKKLKDVLEKEVDEKYYLSSKLLNYVFSNGGKDNNIKGGIGICDEDSDVSPTLTAQYYKMSRQSAYIRTIGNLYGDNKQAGRVYDAEGIRPTLDNMASGGNKSQKIVEPNFGNQRLNELLKMQNIPLDEPVCIDTYNQSVVKDVFCTIKSNIDRENLKYVSEPLSCAMRGRNLADPSDRAKGCVTGQRLEIGDDKANTITTVQKDSMVVEPKLLGYTRDDSGRVVNRTLKDVANTIHTSIGRGGNTDCLVYDPQILTPKRNEYGKSVRKEYESGRLNVSRHNMTDLMPREDGISNTVTTIQKDNLLLEPKQVIGSTQKNAFIGDVDGIAPTINAACGMGGGQTSMILGVTVNPGRKREFENGYIRGDISHTLTAQDAKNTSVVWERANNISYKITDGGKIRAYQNDDKKSGVSEFQIDNEEAIASTVTTTHTPKCYGESMGFRIRKLTPREVFRLQDVDDEDIDELLNSGISNTRLYCMAGNSIVVSVLYHIFRKLFIEKENENQQLTLF